MVLLNNVRNKINVIVNHNEVYSLPGIVFLVGMISQFPYITTRQMEDYFLG